MTDRFPLLRLPQDVLHRALRSMEPLYLILLSFSSNRAKSLVASINMKSKITVLVSNFFEIIAVGERKFRWGFYYNEVINGAIPIKMGTPGVVYLEHFMNGDSKIYVVPKVMDIPSWFRHIKTIFNCSKISLLQFLEDVGNFELDSIRENMIQEDIDELMVSSRISDEYTRRIMETFRNIKNLSLVSTAYENGKPPGEVLIQNFSEFGVGYYSSGPTTMKLDDILMMNAKNVEIVLSELTEKDANRFLKLWMRGNSKLEYFSLSFEMTLDRNTVLKGIKLQEIPLKVKRLFIDFRNLIEGGIDVIRKDGTRGTIILEESFMRFFVWHDYCKVEK